MLGYYQANSIFSFSENTTLKWTILQMLIHDNFLLHG